MTLNDLAELSRVRLLARSGEARAIRIEAGISMREAATAVGVSVSALWRWEHGDRVPHGDAAIPYAQLLETLLEGTAR